MSQTWGICDRCDRLASPKDAYRTREGVLEHYHCQPTKEGKVCLTHKGLARPA